MPSTSTTEPATTSPGPTTTVSVHVGTATTTPAGQTPSATKSTSSGQLPATGAASWLLATIGAALVVLGAALARANRRRRAPTVR